MQTFNDVMSAIRDLLQAAINAHRKTCDEISRRPHKYARVCDEAGREVPTPCDRWPTVTILENGELRVKGEVKQFRVIENFISLLMFQWLCSLVTGVKDDAEATVRWNNQLRGVILTFVSRLAEWQWDREHNAIGYFHVKHGNYPLVEDLPCLDKWMCEFRELLLSDKPPESVRCEAGWRQLFANAVISANAWNGVVTFPTIGKPVRETLNERNCLTMSQVAVVGAHGFRVACVSIAGTMRLDTEEIGFRVVDIPAGPEPMAVDEPMDAIESLAEVPAAEPEVTEKKPGPELDELGLEVPASPAVSGDDIPF